MKSVTVTDPFSGTGATENITPRAALIFSATYLAQARYIFGQLPDPLLVPEVVVAQATKGLLAAQIGEGYAVLADTLGQDY